MDDAVEDVTSSVCSDDSEQHHHDDIVNDDEGEVDQEEEDDCDSGKPVVEDEDEEDFNVLDLEKELKSVNSYWRSPLKGLRLPHMESDLVSEDSDLDE